MRTTIFLMFLLILISGSIHSQDYNLNYIDSETKVELFKIEPYSPYLKKPDLTLIPRYDSPILKNYDGFRLHQETPSVNFDTVKFSSDFAEAEKFPGASRFYAKNPNLLSSPYEKSFILKPDTSIKSYLIIIDPVPHAIRK
jgi:hypothetical protein